MFAKRATMESAFDVQIAVSSKMEQSLQLWSDMYEGYPPWLSEDIRTMNLASVIAGEVARLVTMEMQVSLSGSPMADYLSEQLKPVIKNARKYTEYACAKGGIVLKPYVIEEAEKIAVTIVQPEDFFPTSFDSNGNILGGIFPDQKIIGDRKYTRYEKHELNGNVYTIINKAFVTQISEIGNTNDNVLGKEVSLDSVEDWAGIEPEVVINNVDCPLFAYFKMPMANNVELRSPLGVSVFSKAIGDIREADNQWSNLLWEFKATEAAVFGDEDIFQVDEHGQLKLEGKDKRLFRSFQGLTEQIKEYSPQIRDVSILNGLNNILKQVEFKCSLAYGTISDPQNVDKTATEVKQSKQRSFSLVCDIQAAFKDAHEDLIRAMRTLAILYGLSPDGECEPIFDFDDSIVVDRDVEFQRLMQMASANMIKPEAVTAWYFGIPIEEAQEMLPPAFGKDPEDEPIEEEE